MLILSFFSSNFFNSDFDIDILAFSWTRSEMALKIDFVI